MQIIARKQAKKKSGAVKGSAAPKKKGKLYRNQGEEKAHGRKNPKS